MDVSLETETDGRLLLKLQNDEWEVNVRAPRAELLKLRGIRTANWNERRSIEAGESVGARAFWTVDGENAMLMIGLDDETWDIALSVPVETVGEIVRQAHLIDVG